MTTLIEAARQALEVLQSDLAGQIKKGPLAITSLRQAIEQAEQEPVQTEPNFEQRKQILDNLDRCHHRDSKHEFLRVWIRDWTNHKLLKQTPPQRKPLTDEQIEQVFYEFDDARTYIIAFARAIEAAHGIKGEA